MLIRTDYTIYTLPIFDRVRVRVRFNVQIKYSNSMIFINLLSASWPVRELSSLRLDWLPVGLSASCPVSNMLPLLSSSSSSYCAQKHSKTQVIRQKKEILPYQYLHDVQLLLNKQQQVASPLTFFEQYRCLQDNLPTNQLAVSQVADWTTRGLVNSPTANF